MSANPHKSAFTNRLAQEKSPYLLQHQHNPVDWHAWNEEAFAKAKRENKPIFLSIGYSTCHWCHVMERESFESEPVAAFLNAHFISIKVDREERPDVDKIYMTFVQSVTGQGGWPLSAFLTPELKPFYGGTYFPPESKYGRPSFLQVLEHIQKLWASKREDVIDSANDLHQRLADFTAPELAEEVSLSAKTLAVAFDKFKSEYDPHHGGFGGAPKFPRPTQPAFILQQAVRAGDQAGIEMVLHTCERMAAGGMYDQLGGGFARYSVDAEWLVPHFEKMLYDNAQLVHLYLDAYLVSGNPRFAEVARDVLAYVTRDMTHPEGGFYSAEDADSEGKEGKFYCWTWDELSALLTSEEFNVATEYYGITRSGNFVDHSDPNPLPDQNVLSITQPNVSAADLPLLQSAKQKMLAVRAKRVRPHLDDKVLSSWNGMMLGAFARAYGVLGDETYLQAAEKNLTFLKSKLWDANFKTLYHRWRDGERDSVQLLEAYANLLAGVLELYQVTLKAEHLQFAIELAETMVGRFQDAQSGGFWQSDAGSRDLILRVKEDYDGAEPSGNSVATLALLKLGAITDRKEYKEAAEKSLQLLGKRMNDFPQAVPLMLQALDYALTEPKRIVIAGKLEATETQELLAATHRIYQPHKVVLHNAGPVEEFARTLPERNGKSTAYVCTGTSCLPPEQDAAKLKAMLK